MNDRENELIEKFLDDALTEKEAEELSEYYQSSNEFAGELKRIVDARVAMQSIDSVHRRIKGGKIRSTTVVLRQSSIRWAAVFLVALGIGILIRSQVFQAHDTPDELFIRYYESPTGIGSYRQIEMGMPSYDSVTVNMKDRQDSVASFFYSALYLLDKGKYRDAREKFDIMFSMGGKEFEEESVWYYGLILLKTGDVDGSKAYFKRSAASNGHYSQQSREILKRL